jgi:hypothetical protein
MTDIDPSAPQPGSQPIIPLYNDRLANRSFDPFGPKEGVDIDSRANRGYGQEVSSDPPLDEYELPTNMVASSRQRWICSW